MEAYVWLGEYTEEFDTRKMGDKVKEQNQQSFDDLEWDRGGILEIRLEDDQALFLFGGRSALIEAIDALDKPRRYRIRGFHKDVMMFRGKVKAAGGLKTKQMLMLARCPDDIPDDLAKKIVPFKFKKEIESINLAELKELIERWQNDQ